MDYFENIVTGLLAEQQKNIFKANKKDPDDLSAFVQKRSTGAKKIEKMATAKGGFSLLTAVHFKAKEVPYKVCAKHAEDSDSSFIKEKADECFKKLKNWDKMSQREFQYVMGQLEAYGEFFIRSKEDKGQ
jgi:hypothetical protein